jgi:hypothetical protein
VPVVQVETTVDRSGIFNPFTAAGTTVVSGVAASCFPLPADTDSPFLRRYYHALHKYTVSPHWSVLASVGGSDCTNSWNFDTDYEKLQSGSTPSTLLEYVKTASRLAYSTAVCTSRRAVGYRHDTTPAVPVASPELVVHAAKTQTEL